MISRSEWFSSLIKASKKLLWVCIIAFLLFSVTPAGNLFWRNAMLLVGFATESGRDLSIHFIDVGKADAILIQCDGHYALLDAGTQSDGEKVVNYLKRNSVESLDYAVVSHPDSDHIGGMRTVLKEINCKTLYRSYLFESEYSELQIFMRENGIDEKLLYAGDELSLGSASFSVLGPLREYEETNEGSLVLRLSCNGFSALFCGDIEEEAEKDLLLSNCELSCDVYKVAHHGSRSSAFRKFIEAVNPKYSVICVANDSSGLPDEEPLRLLSEMGSKIYQTDVHGSITVYYSEEGGIRVKTENGDTW